MFGAANAANAEMATSFPSSDRKHFDPDETRTRNLLIRSQTPYPLGHEAVTTLSRRACSHCLFQHFVKCPFIVCAFLFP